VSASRGKQIRAEPVSTLYEQRRIHHVGSWPALEDQMSTWVPGMSTWSPDRMDALVWLFTELMGGKGHRRLRHRNQGEAA
jgi:phage terminase large subunit-like protein